MSEEEKTSIDTTKETINETPQNTDKITDNKTCKTTKPNRRMRRIIVLIVIAIFALSTAVKIRADYLSYIGIGEEYASVFNERVINRYLLTGPLFIIFYIMLYITNCFIFRGLKKFFKDDKMDFPKLPNKTICIILALVFSMIYTNVLYDKLMILKNAAVFGRGDPIFGTDISYYMFILPFIQTFIIAFGVLMLFLIVYIAMYYVIVFNMYFDEGVDVEKLKTNTFVKQEMCLVAVIAILLCVYILLSAQNIFTGTMVNLPDDKSTAITGAGMTDVTIKVWGYRVLSVVVAVSVIRLFRYIKKSNFKQSIISIAIVPVYMLGLFIVMVGFQFAYVGKNELDSEKEFISYNIENTKEAYNIGIEQENIKEYEALTSNQVDTNRDVINNIPLVSKDITLTTISEHQENSVYYSYDNTFLANYNINGQDELVYITPREILTDNTVSYNNKSLKYTHGYSMVVNSATEMDNKGYIKYILSDFQSEDILGITQPRIYFGLDTDSTIKVNTSFGKEYDYPITATTSSENVYDGEAGVTVGFIDRLVLGIKEGNPRLALSRNNTADTKIINNRNVIERAKKIFPDVLYDEEPYLVIDENGRLVWVLDAYTRSASYPYSQMTTINIKGYRERINYIRNSLKVLIDAYDGTTTFYITDKTDPIIMTYRNMYPDLFVEDELPDSIKEHIVYPKFLYDIQAEMINIYHDVSEDTLYRGDDIWEITKKASTTNSTIAGVEMDPYYTMLKTIDNKKAELGLILTYNKLGKQNITSYLVGTVNDGKPKLSLYKFNQENNVVGIMQLNNQIEQDATISEELKAINTSGTKLIKDMIIIPINNSLLYVEPVYQVMLNESEIPALKKVIVATGNTVAIGDNLQIALTNLFSEANSVDLDIVDTEDIGAIIDSVIKANQNLNDSLNVNDFEMIGKDLTRLQNLIKQLENARKTEIEKQIKEEEETIGENIENSSSTNTIETENSNMMNSILENININLP
ncbi:MAG: UPF0182 family protein [Clostridia bacterium]|nr:UPF0182 family protein [Clostridia bacterium]